MANLDPNKYSKNKDIKPESNISSMLAFGRMALMMVGIIGLSLELFRDDGWLKTGLSKLFESTTSMMLIPVIILSLWLLNRWMSSGSKGETRKSGDVPMYLMMLAGAYYLFTFMTSGTF